MYGDLETDNECWYAIVPQYDPWFDDGDFDEEEYEDALRAGLRPCPHSTKNKPNARTVLTIFIPKR